MRVKSGAVREPCERSVRVVRAVIGGLHVRSDKIKVMYKFMLHIVSVQVSVFRHGLLSPFWNVTLVKGSKY